MRFNEVIGHGKLKEFLARNIAEKRVSHAQLFSGETGAGAFALALAYITYLNCADRQEGDSCGRCSSCVKMSQLAHPDVHFIFPAGSQKAGSQRTASDNHIAAWREMVCSAGAYFDEQAWYKAINIENQQGIISRAEADEIIRKLSLKPFEADYKTVVIWLPERMRPEASNTILKILEEPWERTLFILVSESPAKLLPTIISRTQEVSVPGIDPQEIHDLLTQKYPGREKEAETVSRLCAGNFVTAVAKMEQGGTGGSGEFFPLFAALMRFSYNDRHMELLEWGEQVAALGREQQKRFLEYSLRMLRENYMLNAGMENLTYLLGEELDFSRKFSPFIGNHNVEEIAVHLQTAISHVGQNGNPRIIFPHMALEVSKLIIR